MTERPVRVRIAPSPTGDPHVGTAYVALFNYVFAKSQGGTFVLRIEDTDQTRARRDSEQMIFDALHWCGLTWDEGPDVGGPFGPYRQSERTEHYREHAAILVAKGEAYPCFCTEDRLAKARALAQAEKRAHIGYDRLCRAIEPAVAATRAAAEPHTIRLKMPLTGKIIVRDQLRAKPIEIDAGEVDDQVLLKSDGFPTYHLANVVDDHLMEITHVIRAEEWITSTPKHVMLYKAFGWEEPRFYHLGLLRNSDKSKISKRKNPVSINYYRDCGYLPTALLNFLGNMGWSFGNDTEKFTLAQMIEVFTWDRSSLNGPVFDLVKLGSLNEKYIQELTPLQLADALIAWRFSREQLARVAPLVQKRIKKLDDAFGKIDFVYAGDLDYKPVLAEMVVPEVAPADVAAALLAFVERFETREGFTVAMLEEESTAWLAGLGWQKKHAFMLLRLAISGRTTSPDLFPTMEVLGKEITRRRLREAARALLAPPPPAPKPPKA